jgi:hypothetical protein
MEITMPDYGKTAYEAYVREVGGHSAITGATLPSWEDQQPLVKRAWYAAAEAVIHECSK